MKRKKTTVFLGLGILVAALLTAYLNIEIGFFVEPKYCRLLFGPDADTQVVLGVKRERLYLYRGSIPQGPAETFRLKWDYWQPDPAVRLSSANGTTRYKITTINFDQNEKPGESDRLSVCVTVDGPIQCRQYCDVELRDASGELAIAHFDGPLTVGPTNIGWETAKTPLVIGDEPTDIRANVGTKDPDRGCWTVVQSQNHKDPAFPEGVFPYVEIEFPPRTPDGKSVTQRFALNEFC